MWTKLVQILNYLLFYVICNVHPQFCSSAVKSMICSFAIDIIITCSNKTHKQYILFWKPLYTSARFHSHFASIIVLSLAWRCLYYLLLDSYVAFVFKSFWRTAIFQTYGNGERKSLISVFIPLSAGEDLKRKWTGSFCHEKIAPLPPTLYQIVLRLSRKILSCQP